MSITTANSLREAIERDGLSPATALAVLAEMLRDMPTVDKRRCWACGQPHWHADSRMPYVLCPLCGSQDTRLIKVGVPESR